MNKSILRLGAAAAAASILMAAAPSRAEEGRFAAFLPPANPVVKYGAEPFIERVTADTDGALTYRLFTGGSLLGGKNMVEGLQSGIADVGQIVFGYFPAEFPYAALIADMAIYGSNAPAIAAAVTEFSMLHCDGCVDELKRQGIVSLGTTSTSPYVLMSRDEIATLEQLKGKKVRTPGSLWDRWVRHAGGTPVNISAGEIYEALSRGQVDAVLNAVGALQSHSLWDTAKHVTNLQLGTYRSWGIFSVSAKHWAALPPEQRRVLLDNAARGVIEAALGYVAADELALEQLGEKGITMHEPDADMLTQLTAFRESDWPKVMENAQNQFGIAEPEPLMDEFIALVDKWTALYEPLDGDVDAMTELLQKEVTSKIDENTYGL